MKPNLFNFAKFSRIVSRINYLYSLSIKSYPDVSSIEELLYLSSASVSLGGRSLDLGCGNNIKNPFNARIVFGVDICPSTSEFVREADLSIENIPYATKEFDYCTAFDFLEHIPRISWAGGRRRNAFIELMNEVYRVLTPGGLFLHVTPAYPSKEVFQDPTHVNFITEDTMPFYFCRPNSYASKMNYGFVGTFDLVSQGWLYKSWVITLMRAIK